MASRFTGRRHLVCASLAVSLVMSSPLTAQAAVGYASNSSAISRAAAIAASNATTASPSSVLAAPAQTSLLDAIDAAPTAVGTKIDEATSLQTAQTRYEYVQAAQAAKQAREKTDKVLSYDPTLIAAIGNQLEGGHTICCPAYACAYGDAVLTGIANDHAAYGCGCCTWPGWGGGNSSFRSVGSDAQLLREAYDEIGAGRPTVIHVSGPYGEHWISLIGYQNAADPDNLTLDNFIALDPANGREVVASYRYVLYGDGCEHISDLR